MRRRYFAFLLLGLPSEPHPPQAVPLPLGKGKAWSLQFLFGGFVGGVCRRGCAAQICAFLLLGLSVGLGASAWLGVSDGLLCCWDGCVAVLAVLLLCFAVGL